MTTGVIEGVVTRLIPFPFPGTTGQEDQPRMYEITIGGNTTRFTEIDRDDVVVSAGIYTVIIGFWGFVTVQYDSSNSGSLPADGVTQTILTIDGFKISDLYETVISDEITQDSGGGAIEVKVIGDATLNGDTTPPELSLMTDNANGVTAGYLSASTDEDNGTIYWVVTTSSTTPTTSQVAAGQDHTGAAAVWASSQLVTTTGVQVATPAPSGLTGSTTYYGHAMHEDAANNRSLVKSGNGFTTGAAGDTTPPTLSLPVDTANGVTGASLQVTTNEANGNLYWVVTTSATTPSKAQIKAGQTHTGAGANASGSQAVVSTGIQSMLATGLSGATQYFAHFMHEDGAGNQSNNLSGDGFTTQSAGGGGGSPSADVVVYSTTDLYTTLGDWQAHPSPFPRTVGIGAITGGNLNLDGYDFSGSGKVTVRHVGNYTADSYGESSCSNYHQCGSGQFVNMNNSKNLDLLLADIRANHPTFAWNNGLITADNSVDCGIIRSAIKGYPFNYLTFNNTGSSSQGINAHNPVRFTIKGNAGYYWGDGLARLFGGTNVLWEANTGRWYGGDDLTVASDYTCNDFIFQYNVWCRWRAPRFGLHNDALQFNQRVTANRWTGRYDIFYHGNWTGDANRMTSGEGGWAAYYTEGGSLPSSGPHLWEQNLVLNGNSRGIGGISGGGNTANYNTALQHDQDMPGQTGFPIINKNFISAGDYNIASSPTTFGVTKNYVGPNGICHVLGGDYKSGYNLGIIDFYWTKRPTNYDDLWDIRPPITSPMHPGYSGTRRGCYGLWDNLYSANPAQVLSMQGWPNGPVFLADIDRSNNFGIGYTGTFDADGDNL